MTITANRNTQKRYDDAHGVSPGTGKSSKSDSMHMLKGPKVRGRLMAHAEPATVPYAHSAEKREKERTRVYTYLSHWPTNFSQSSVCSNFLSASSRKLGVGGVKQAVLRLGGVKSSRACGNTEPR